MEIVRPTASFSQDEYVILRYDDFTLTCETSGSPEPVITFEKVSVDSLGSNVQIDGNILRFSDAQPENRGIYQCTAESNGVTAKASTIVDMEGE